MGLDPAAGRIGYALGIAACFQPIRPSRGKVVGKLSWPWLSVWRWAPEVVCGRWFNGEDGSGMGLYFSETAAAFRVTFLVEAPTVKAAPQIADRWQNLLAAIREGPQPMEALSANGQVCRSPTVNRKEAGGPPLSLQHPFPRLAAIS
jgi:hypothetical protein